MENENVTTDTLDNGDFNQPKMSGTLNVITILSIIGCIIQLLGSAWGFFSSKTSFENKDKVIEQMNSGKMPSWAKSMMPDMTHFEEIALCFYGVMQMRKLKKQGFLFYVIGELLPFLTSAFFIGTFTLAGTYAVVGFVIAAIFIILYATQRKNLIY
jgi:magnesium-transporting ATPase (P-type)